MYKTALLLLLSLSSAACARDIYVDGASGNDQASGAATAPVRTSWHAVDLAQPGDTIHLRPTTVYPAMGILNKSGTPNAYITIMGDGPPSNMTKVIGSNQFAMQVNQGASYISVLNLDLSSTGARTGIFIGAGSHHVLVQGNVVHDNGNCGICTVQADYIAILHNTVYSNAANTSNGTFGSGISVYENTDIDNATGVKMLIDGNLVYNNTNTPTPGIANGTDSDGNGIIVDDSRHTQSNNIAYRGTTMVRNNVVAGNGGRGVDTYESDHVQVINNTAYGNNTDPYESAWHPGEIMVEQGGGDIAIYNNIADAAAPGSTSLTGYHTAITVADATDGAGSVTLGNNALYDAAGVSAQATFLGSASHPVTNALSFQSSNLWGNPLFANAGAKTMAAANFMLQPGSPALATGMKSVAPPADIRGMVRGLKIDAGAFQQTQ